MWCGCHTFRRKVGRRSKADAPEIDGEIHLCDTAGLKLGYLVKLLLENSDQHDLYGVPL